jgi:hypothetical protein
MREPPTFAAITSAVEAAGLAVRGGLQVAPGDRVPSLAKGRPARALVLVGDIGGRIWPLFVASSEYADRAPHALDRWSRRIVEGVARRVGGEALFPFAGPPHHPFQAWAERAEPLHRSPLGLLLHPAFGLWHSFRGAIAFADDVLDLPAVVACASPCMTCVGRPCLVACPVGAFSGAAYDVPACAGHLGADAGAPCRGGGCLARRACPVGAEHAYGPVQQAFHMQAFIAGLPA